MHWLQQVDNALFHFINLTLANPVFDWLMPFASGNPFFGPAVAILAVLLLWKGGPRGRIFLVALVLALLVTDPLVVNNLKKLVGRERPFFTLEDARVLVGRGGSGSFPSAHAANWFAVVAVTLVYYRRSLIVVLPLACLIAFSRVYNGVHYVSDILGGAVIGMGAGLAAVWLLDQLWKLVGQHWFPLWWQHFPSLTDPPDHLPNCIPGVVGPPEVAAKHNQYWFRLGCLLLGIVLIGRLIYIASGTIELSEDEAYYWLWSQEPALSYYSKPPLVAYTIGLGTMLWGDTELGIRFFSPVIGALIAFLLLRFFMRMGNAKAGVVLILMCLAVPLLGVGSVLMTIDPLSVLFWVAAMLAGWRAIQSGGTTRNWLWVGLWMGLGLFSKYVAFFQLLCWACVFLLLPFSRVHLRRAGPYLALLVMCLFLVPVVIWNQQHDWITVTHVSESTSATSRWKPTLRYLNDFFFSEFGLLNPFFFVAAWIAGVGVWRQKPGDPRERYLFCMGAPLFLFLLLYSLKARILPNWIAPSILPLLAMTVMYWWRQPVSDTRWFRNLTWTGLIFGFCAVGVLHNTDIIKRITGKPLPAEYDPLRRVRGWAATASEVSKARNALAAEGKPVFIIGHHYGVTSELSFYMPESRTNLPASRLVYYLTSAHPDNQFFFWPGYEDRKGQNALYVVDFSPKNPHPVQPPPRLLKQFATVTTKGMIPIKRHGRTLRWIELFECRDLR